MNELKNCPMCFGEIEVCLDEGILLCKDCGFCYTIAEDLENTIKDFNERKTDPRLLGAVKEIRTTEYYDDWGGESAKGEQKRILDILEKWIPGLKEKQI